MSEALLVAVINGAVTVISIVGTASIWWMKFKIEANKVRKIAQQTKVAVDLTKDATVANTEAVIKVHESVDLTKTATEATTEAVNKVHEIVNSQRDAMMEKIAKLEEIITELKTSRRVEDAFKSGQANMPQE